MGRNHIIDNFIQPSAQNCCCDGLYCNSKLNMEKQNRFASMWEDFGKMNTHIFDDFEGMFPVMGFSNFTPTRFGQNFSSGTTELQNFTTSDQVKISNEKDRLEMVFDTTGFDKDELSISRQGRIVTIEGKTKSEKSSNESTEKSSSYVSRQFSRSYTVPSSCNMDKMKSILANNKLTISIPKNQVEIENAASRQVPIEFKESKPTPTISRKLDKEMASNKIQKTISEKTNYRKDSDQVRTVPVTLTEKATSSVTNNAIREQENKQSNVNECETRSLHDSRWTPSFIRPILLFNKDDSIFNTSIQSKFEDSIKDMFPCTSNFSRDVEINENDEKELTLKFDLKDYKPNELKVTVLDNVLKIEAKHEENTEGNHVSKQFVRSYVLPAEYKAKLVQSSLSKSGKLTVVVPKQSQREKSIVRDIPIKMD